MEKGSLIMGNGKVYFARSESIANKFSGIGMLTYGNPMIYAWHCKNCGRIDLTTKNEKFILKK